jgi:hypothetical protein
MTKHFTEDFICTIPDNSNLYFPTDVDDWMKRKEIYYEDGTHKCYMDKKFVFEFESLEEAVLNLEKL